MYHPDVQYLLKLLRGHYLYPRQVKLIDEGMTLLLKFHTISAFKLHNTKLPKAFKLAGFCPVRDNKGHYWMRVKMIDYIHGISFNSDQHYHDYMKAKRLLDASRKRFDRVMVHAQKQLDKSRQNQSLFDEGKTEYEQRLVNLSNMKYGCQITWNSTRDSRIEKMKRTVEKYERENPKQVHKPIIQPEWIKIADTLSKDERKIP